MEKKEGKLKKHEGITITDLPGIYSLSPYTPEEVVARNYLIQERQGQFANSCTFPLFPVIFRLQSFLRRLFGGKAHVSIIGGNIIVNVKESRIAVSREMAQKIMV